MIRTCLQHGIFEELTEERRRQVHSEMLASIGSGMLRNLEHRVRADGEEESGRVEDLGLFHQSPVVLVLKMGHGEVVSSVQLGHQGSMFTSDENSALASGVFGGLLVLDQESSLIGNSLKDVARFVSS